MTATRDNPYGGFNFRVEIAGERVAGFQEVSGLGEEIQVLEYRDGSDTTNHVRKLPGLYGVNDVTLRRGLIGATDLWDWAKQARQGDMTARRNITIFLQDESQNSAVMVWALYSTFPRSWRLSSLNAQDGAIAIEELVLACEEIELIS